MAPIHFPTFSLEPVPVHQPLIEPGNDATQAATSLESGSFQYVNSSLFNGNAFLSNVSASAIDSATGKIYLLRRSQPNLVILNANGSISREIDDPDLLAGHSIKLIDVGKGAQPWVVDVQSSMIRIYSQDGLFQESIGPTIEYHPTDGELAPASRLGVSIQFGKITDIAYDPKASQLYVTDGDVGGNRRVIVLNTEGRWVATWGPKSQSIVELDVTVPHAVAVDPWSRVWVVDSETSHVKVINRSGKVLNTWRFPELTLYGIAISTTRATPNSAMIYLAGNKKATETATDQLPSSPGAILLLKTNYIPGQVDDIGSNTPLTKWENQPCERLHWISCGSVNGEHLMIVNEWPSATSGASAYKLSAKRPVFDSLQPPKPQHPPNWPESFHSVAILQPFEKDNHLFAVAELWYKEKKYIQADIYALSGITLSYRYFLDREDTVYQFSLNGSPYSDQVSTTRKIPDRDWIAERATFQGELQLLNKSTNWWYERYGKGNLNWYWFRNDKNTPWRTMNSDQSVPNNVPILQDWAFINWLNFTSSSPQLPDLPNPAAHKAETKPRCGILPKSIESTLFNPTHSSATALKILVDHCNIGKLDITEEKISVNIAKIGELVPGLTPGDGGLRLPVWPRRFFMTCTMTAINEKDPMSTEVLYDWNNPIPQRTRMLHWAGNSATDAILTYDRAHQPDAGGDGHIDGTTYIIDRYDDGTHACQNPIRGIGPVPPRWAFAGKSSIVATITNHPELSPGYTIRIFNCPFDHETQSQFWIWYSSEHSKDTPIVFGQTLPPPKVGTNLAIADYNKLEETTLIDPVSFAIPQTCLAHEN